MAVRYDRYDAYDAPPLVQWRAVFAGAVIGLGVLMLLTTLWGALGFAADQSYIASNFRWFEAGSAVFALFLGAFFAGSFAGVRGFGAGFANAATLWGLTVIGAALIGVPSVMRMFDLRFASLTTRLGATSAGATATGTSPRIFLWTAFLSIVIGLGAALLGGFLGGAMPRSRRVRTSTPAYAPPREVPATTEYRRTGTEH